MPELWDIYDKNRNRTGRTILRQAFFDGSMRLSPGEYHLVVIIVVLNPKGEILCTRRSPNKHAPGMWENTGGSALAGEDSLPAALRELREETGIALQPEDLTLFYQQSRHGDTLYDIYLTVQDIPAEAVVLQEGETDAAAWFPYDVWEKKARAAEVLTPAGHDCDEFFEKLRNFIDKGAL